jgi:AcrR family transcriptional regulator
MMTTLKRTKQDVVAEFRSTEVLGSARKVFAKKGFADATMDDIAAAAGLAKGTLYLYFKSKRDVYLKTLQQGCAELLAHVATNMQAVEGVRAKIRALVATRVKYADENRDFFKIYLTEFNGATQTAPISKESRDTYFKQVQAVEQALRGGVDSGDIQELDVEATAFMIQDMSKSLITRRLLGWSKKGVEEDIDFLCGFIWRAIGCK